MAISVRLTEEEHRLATSYARIHGISIEKAFKQALFDRIEDEYDLEIARAALDDYAKSGYKSTPIAEFWEELHREQL